MTVQSSSISPASSSFQFEFQHQTRLNRLCFQSWRLRYPYFLRRVLSTFSTFFFVENFQLIIFLIFGNCQLFKIVQTINFEEILINLKSSAKIKRIFKKFKYCNFRVLKMDNFFNFQKLWNYLAFLKIINFTEILSNSLLFYFSAIFNYWKFWTNIRKLASFFIFENWELFKIFQNRQFRRNKDKFNFYYFFWNFNLLEILENCQFWKKFHMLSMLEKISQNWQF